MTDSELRVIGVDPGINHTGYGIISKVTNKVTCLSKGSISSSVKLDFPLRLQKIYQSLGDIIKLWYPDIMAIEETIYAQNMKTALKLGQARGVVLLAGANFGLDIYEYSPKKIKSSVTGNGAATKEQVRFMITRILNLEKAPLSLDASDALAAALCHLNQNRILILKKAEKYKKVY